jgi:hypothetical protein
MIIPVKVPFTVTADMTKYAGQVFNNSPGSAYLQQKIEELDSYGDEICATLPGSAEFVQQLGDYCGIKEKNDISSIALQLEEDVAILHQGKLVSICFCFPSGFVPSSKLGMNFFDMHIPVAQGDILRAASEKVTKLISREGSSFRRYVWTITSLSGLSQHPAYTRPHPHDISDLYFRTETQTTIGLANEICLFFVKVEMKPFEHIWDDKDHRKLVLESINSMSESVLDYKNLHAVKDILNRS